MSRNYTNAEAAKWYQEMIQQPEKFPFIFTYGGKQYNGFSSDEMKLTGTHTRTDAKKVTTDVTFLLEDTLEITLKTGL